MTDHASGAAVQWLVLGIFAALLIAGALTLGVENWRPGALVVIGGLLGLALYHGAFGFNAAYQRAMTDRDMGGAPKDVSQPQNSLVRVANWACTSRPMTASQDIV